MSFYHLIKQLEEKYCYCDKDLSWKMRYNIFEQVFYSEKRLKPERLKLPNDPSRKGYIHVKKKFNLQLQTFCFLRKKHEFYKIAFEGRKMFVLSSEWEKPKCKFACKYSHSLIFVANTKKSNSIVKVETQKKIKRHKPLSTKNKAIVMFQPGPDFMKLLGTYLGA